MTASSGSTWSVAETAAMGLAMAAAHGVRTTTSPNPWVGATVLDANGAVVAVGATEPVGGAHAEVVALARAGAAARGGTVVTTLEPCCHQGRTPPCTDALLDAGVARVVVGVLDPDPQVGGRGVATLRQSGVDVAVGLADTQVGDQLAAYLAQRRRGWPYVVLKLAATADGRIAAPDGSAAWITGPLARADVQRLRAECDAIVVGAGTVRRDDPQLTVRDPWGRPVDHQPLRVVLGAVPVGARVAPALSLVGEPAEVLAELGRRGVVQVLVEGGSSVAGAFHRAGLVDRYVLYWAPKLFGGADAQPMFSGAGAATIDGCWRGRLLGVRRLGDDLRMDLAPASEHGGPAGVPSDRKAA